MNSALPSSSQPASSWRSRLSDFYHRNSSLLAIGLAFSAARLLADFFTQMTFAGYGPTYGQFLSQGQFSLGGAYPFLQYWTEYPPLFPWLTVAAYRLSLLVPLWGDPTLWFGALVRWVTLPFEVGALMLVAAIAQRLYPESDGTRSTLFYALAFATVYVPLGWFDALPLFWLLLALYFSLRDRPLWAGLSAGLGLLTKPIPALALPVLWQRLPDLKTRLKMAGVAAAAFVLPMLPFVIASPQMSLAHLNSLLNRSSWETVWALVDGYYSYGAVAPLDQRFDPATASASVHPGGAYSLWATAAFGLLGLYLWTRRIDWRDARRSVAFVGLTWCLFSLWSKGYSPQWAINYIPFVALLLPDLRGAVYLVLIGVGLVAEWPVAFTLAANQPWYLGAIVIWRTALTVLLSVEMGAIALAGQPRRAMRAAYWTAIAGLLAAGVVIAGRAYRGYWQYRLDNEPLRATIRLLRAEAAPPAGLICREVAVCERIAPFTPGLEVFWLPSPSNWQAANLAAFAGRHPVLWLVEEYHPGSGHDTSIEEYLGQHYGKVSQDWVDGARVSRFAALDLPPDQSSGAEFGDGLRLDSYAVKVTDEFINVGLTWQATAPVKSSYKVFVHVFDASGHLIGQNDQYPQGGFMPTDQWLTGQSVHDLHGLILAEPMLPGDHLKVGWYDPGTGRRLKLAGSGADSLELPVR